MWGGIGTIDTEASFFGTVTTPCCSLRYGLAWMEVRRGRKGDVLELSEFHSMTYGRYGMPPKMPPAAIASSRPRYARYYDYQGSGLKAGSRLKTPRAYHHTFTQVFWALHALFHFA
jgi:hypothetical protein